MRIQPSEVSAVLMDCFGPGCDSDRSCAEGLAEMLSGWVPFEAPLESVKRSAEDLVLRYLYRNLGNPPMIPAGDGTRRLRTADLSDAGDRMLGLLFGALPEDEESLSFVRDYAFRGSLSAVACLAQRFPDLQSPEERRMAARIASSRMSERNASAE